MRARRPDYFFCIVSISLRAGFLWPPRWRVMRGGV
jgi:hypothetical protein